MGNSNLWIVIEFIYSSINVILVYLFMQVFLKTKSEIHTIWKIIAIVAVVTVKAFAGHISNENIIIFSSITISTTLVMGLVFFKVKILTVLLITGLSFLAGVSSELLTILMISGHQEIPLTEVVQFNVYRLQARTLSYLAYLVVIAIIRRFMGVRMQNISTKLMLVLCSLPLVSILVAQQFFIHMVSPTYVPTISEIIPLISIIIVNVFIFVLVENLIRQNEKNQELLLIKMQSDSQQQHIKQLLGTYEQIREISHDFKHQASLLYTLFEEKRLDELGNKLSNLSNQAQTSLIFNTGNIYLDAVLSSKKQETEQQGVKFTLKLDVQPNLSYLNIDMDICVLLSNALDNAIEACNRSSEEAKIIEMELKANTSVFMFRMRNTLGEIPELENDLFKTKKQESFSHGIGLRSMKRTCDKLEGDIEYTYNQKHFIIKVYIPFMGLEGNKFAVRH